MGQVIAGRFELASHIASGGSGAIWTAWDRRHHAWCAAKVLRQKDSGELLRFVREQGIQLDHRHLATPYGWAAEDADVAISMPLVAGGTLDTALGDHGALSSALTAHLLLQLLDALDHVHAAGWIHRDVKPANILLEPTGEAEPHLRLGDFGIAVREDDPRFTSLGWVNGTPGYLAPEVMDLAAPAPAQDFFAAGVVALRMLDPTLRGERELGAAVLQPRRTLDAIPDLDPRLATTLAGLLATEPGRRVEAAAAAPRELAGLRRPDGPDGGYLTADGEPFTVFRQIETGPLRSPAPEPRVPSPPARTPTVGGGEDTPTPAPQDRGRGLGRVVPWLLVLLGVVALAVSAVLLWPRDGTAGPAESDPGSGGASASPSAASAPASSAPESPAPESAAPPSSSPAPTGPRQASPSGAPDRTTPAPSGSAGTGPAITSSVREGDACTALERELVVTGSDGQRLGCSRDGDAWTWQVVD